MQSHSRFPDIGPVTIRFVVTGINSRGSLSENRGVSFPAPHNLWIYYVHAGRKRSMYNCFYTQLHYNGHCNRYTDLL